MIPSLLLGLTGCVSATSELQAVSTQAELNRATQKAQTTETAAAQPVQTAEASQTTQSTPAELPVLVPDQLYPVMAATPVDPTAEAQAAANAIQPGSLVAQPTGISATTNSIYAAPQTLNAQLAAIEAGQQVDPAAVPASALPVMVPVPAVSPLKASLYQAPLATNTETAIIEPGAAAPEAQAEVKTAEAVPVAQEPIVTAMLDPAPNGVEAYPGQFAAQIPLTKAHEDDEEIQNADGVMKTRSIDGLDDGIEPMPSMRDLKGKPKKKGFSLADLFKRKKSADGFNQDRFGKTPSGVKVAAMPAMTNPVLNDALPGVKANAMFPTDPGDASAEESSDDEPAGLMKLASLPSLTRQPMNGLWMQTDEVEVRCLRPDLVRMIKYVEAHYKRPVVVTSGYRDRKHNRRVGGVRGSLHMLCAAADIQVEGVTKWQLAEYLRTIPGRGGVGTYCHTDSVHIDIGSERDWNWRCRRKKKKHRS